MNNSVDTAPPFLPYKERTSAYISALDTNLVSFSLNCRGDHTSVRSTCPTNSSIIAQF